MPSPVTSWDLLGQAAGGDPSASSRFHELYAPVVRETLRARWRGRPLAQDVDDAAQDVMLECLANGALERALERASSGFRAWLHGITRNIARRFEERAGKRRDAPGTTPLVSAALPPLEPALSQFFDRAWARSLVHQARRRQSEQARTNGDGAERRVELLHLRFFEGLPIRDIATRWQQEPARVHHEYAKAREEFRAALKAVLAEHEPGPDAHLERELVSVLNDLA